MRTNQSFFLTGMLVAVLVAGGSCGRNNTPSATAEATGASEVAIELKDYGKAPAVLDIEAYTVGNGNFRTALWTGTNLQVTLMTIPIGEDIGLELHPDIDQFLRIEQGEGRVLMGDTEENLDFAQDVKADYAVFVPAGKWHNLVNTGSEPLKLYSIYAPAEHPHGTVHKTRSEAMEAERHH